MTSFSERVIRVLKRVPRGKVVTYGQVAAMAGNPRGARQVVRILNTHSEKERLPWQRVINREGKIALPRAGGFELQKKLLQVEGVRVSKEGAIDLTLYQWRPRRS